MSNYTRQQVIESLDLLMYFSTQVGAEVIADGDGWSQKLLCKFHQDSRASMNVNIKSGGFKCFACEKNGSIFDFHCMINGRDPRGEGNFVWALNELAAMAGLKGDGGYKPMVRKDLDSINQQAVRKPKVNQADKIDGAQPPLDSTLADKYNSELRPHHIRYLNEVRGLSKWAIETFKIGFKGNAAVKTPSGNVSRGRYTIPIFNRKSELRNIRLNSPDAVKEQKTINTKGYGKPCRLFPLNMLIEYNWSHVIICEGEYDCMLMIDKLHEAGLLDTWGAVTGTHGATTFEAEWLDDLAGRNVYIMYDADVPGKSAASEIATKHFLPGVKDGIYKSVKVITLPVVKGTPDDKDVTDYFVKDCEQLDTIITAIDEAEPIVPGGMENDDASVRPIEVDNLIRCVMDQKYIDKRVCVPITISGQTNRIFHATREYQVTSCPAKDDCCSRDSGDRVIPYGHDIFIASCMASKVQVQAALRCVACTMQQKCNVQATKKVVMQEYFAHQVVQRWRVKENMQGKMENVQELTVIPIYILQPETSMRIEPTNYMATGWIRSHPATQQATLFVETLEPLEDEWKSFEVNDDSIRIFKHLKETGVGDILEDITNNVTRIYDSNDILLTVLLTYLSPLWITFNGEVIRGWINSCIIGDSGTGKSSTYSRISDWMELGDLFSVLTGTRTGLLYSIKQKGSEWYVHIGRYVSADGKIIAVDETQETPAEEIKKMAIAMDEGRLEINQVAQAFYHTKTRTIFLMNPKHGKKISDFPYGCQALPECFDPMFIRRIDLAVFCVAKENHDYYNRIVNSTAETVKSKINAAEFKSLVFWAWTRKSDDIHFSNESVQTCMNRARELSDKYGYTDDIPLVDPQGFRKELARIATAYAILDCSFTDDFKGVVVKEEHIDLIAKFIDLIYSSASCNLLQHSKMRRKINRLDDFDTIKNSFESIIKVAESSASMTYKHSNYFCQLLILLQQQQHDMRSIDLREQVGLSMKWLSRHLTILRAFSLVEFSGHGWRTTRKFNLFMLQWTRDPKIELMLSETQSKIGQVAMRSDTTSEWYGENDGDVEARMHQPSEVEPF